MSQSPCCQLQHVQARQSTSKPPWLSPLAHAQVRRLPQGHFDFDRELLNIGVQKLEDIFSMVLMKFRAWGLKSGNHYIYIVMVFRA